MSIRVALNHKSIYHYDRLVSLGPQIVRLRPAPHCRTTILSYSLKITPKEHFLNWQQDPQGNYQARLVFPSKAKEFKVEVDLIAEMTVINPFDFFIEEYADKVPFKYDPLLDHELQPFLDTGEMTPKLKEFMSKIDFSPSNTVNFLVALNQSIQHVVKYLIRMEPGVQSAEETLTIGSGSCRDSSWLLVQVLRHLGMAARFVSGYLIQLVPDVKSIDGPNGPENDFTDLHAWTEVYLPGAGWVGLDPTSGLFAGEGHIPLACTPDPQTAAPISGGVDESEVEFVHEMSLTRIEEVPRVTKPYVDSEWDKINLLGDQIDAQLEQNDVRLTIGGEPTFVSIDDMEGPEWNNAAVGPNKRVLSEKLIKRLHKKFSPGGLLHYGQGKWYPGESLPRWALTCYWRKDGVPIWDNLDLIADIEKDYKHTVEHAKLFVRHLTRILGVSTRWVLPAYEDIGYYLWKEQKLPINTDPKDSKLSDPEERARLAKVFERGLGEPSGFVLPIKRQWWQSKPRWASGPWPVRQGKMFLLPGDSSIGLRLPIDTLPWIPASEIPQLYPPDPMMELPPLEKPKYQSKQTYLKGVPESTGITGITEQQLPEEKHEESNPNDPPSIVRTALCVEAKYGRVHIFMPPTETLDDYLDMIAAIERTAADLKMPVVIEGYLPPHDNRINNLKVTPDPGVIEVNTHPSSSWKELVDTTTTIYEEARWTRLGTEKFDLDGKHTGTGGGNHIVLGGKTPVDSPFLRRPDILKSMLTYWVNHPSMSYLFSGRFIGPTSQAPRVDEGRKDALYELQLALSLIPGPNFHCPPWLVDRILRNLLIDLTGNTHRAEFCIDKLYSPDSSTGRLGLLELRGFEMPPHAQMSLTQQLVIRGLILKFWKDPFNAPLVDWGTSLHDRFLLPYFVMQDFNEVINDLKYSGMNFDTNWFASHFEFRFPLIGEVTYQDINLEVRNAIEPWYVLGEEAGGGGTVRFVDSSVERVQVRVRGLTHNRHVITVNGRRVPLSPTGRPGEYVAGVRYRAWWPTSCLHPTIPIHTPLVFDILDTWSQRSIGGCTYHVSHPAGRNYETFPVNAYEAEARRMARFYTIGHTPGPMQTPPEEYNPIHPLTLDLRRPANLT
jgi:uncharacterized protein (DUF2126 family)